MPRMTATIVESPDVPRLFIKRMTHPAISAAIEPTERSMPPEMMTKHMPTAMMPMKAVRVSTFMALSKRGEVGIEQRARHTEKREANDRPDPVEARPPRSTCRRSGRAPRRGL